MRRLSLLSALLALACQAFSTPFILGNGLPHDPGSAPTASRPLAPAAARAGEPAPGPTAVPAFALRLHPDGPLYVGDQVSLVVIAPGGAGADGQKAAVHVDPPEGPVLGPTEFRPAGIAGRWQATLQWAWDTRGLPAGPHTLAISVQPDGPAWAETVHLEPEQSLPPAEAAARWATAESGCCLLFYLTGTAAERDLAELLRASDEEADRAARRMRAGLDERVPLVLLPRLMGHGGFAGQELYISYLDRNYAGSDLALVLRHEMVHWIDGRLGGDLRPSILAEGLAVYLTGGHYKSEPLRARAAALLDLGWYLPLDSLSDAFYTAQHEIGYLEAGALVGYLIETWGWAAFSDFYRDIHPHPSGSQARAIEAALQVHFGLSLAELEERFLEDLRRRPLIPDLRDDLALTVELYDAVRRYQRQMDPSAYFLTAWLPGVEAMRQRGIVADYLRRPDRPENQALELMFVAAGEGLRAGRFSEARRHLAAIEAVLDRGPTVGLQAFSPHPLAMEYLSLVQALRGRGYSPQRARLGGGQARVLVTISGSELVELTLVRGREGWEFAGSRRQTKSSRRFDAGRLTAAGKALANLTAVRGNLATSPQ